MWTPSALLLGLKVTCRKFVCGEGEPGDEAKLTIGTYVCMYSSPFIERPLPQKATSSYRPLQPCTHALTVHTIKPPLEDHLHLGTKLRWI